MHKIKKFFYCLIASLCVINSCQAAELDEQFHDAAGNQIQLTDLKGKWVILNYWASWCDICIREIPELNNFYQHNKKKDAVLYGVNYDQLPLPELQKELGKMHILYPAFVENPALTLHLSSFDALPVTFIIAPDGTVAKKIFGPNTEQSLTATLRELQENFAA